MKRYVSKALKIIAALYMGFPITYLVTVALLFDIPGSQCLRILLSPSYYLLSFVAVAAGFGLWEMRRWGWYLLCTANLLIGYENALLVSERGQSLHKIETFTLSILGLLYITHRIGKEVRVPYFLPRIRWWESDPRYRLSAPVQIQRTNGEAAQGDILDLSLGGCFIKVRTELMQDETVVLRFKLFGLAVDCAGTVVWQTQSAVTHPKGVGVKFAAMPKPVRRTLKLINHRLKEISHLYKTSRYLTNQEDFFKKMEQLQTHEIVELKSKARA